MFRMLADEPEGFCNKQEYMESCRVVLELNLVLEIAIKGGERPWQYENVYKLLNWLETGEVVGKVVIDHCAKPDFAARKHFDLWKKWIISLRKFQTLNLYFKLSGLVTEASDLQDWDGKDILPVVYHVISNFSPLSCMYGSDWFISTLARGGHESEWLVVLDKILDRVGLSKDEKDHVFGFVASYVYNLPQ